MFKGILTFISYAVRLNMYFSNKRYSVFAECTANIYIGVQLEYKFVVQYSLDLQYYCILKKCSVHGSKQLWLGFVLCRKCSTPFQNSIDAKNSATRGQHWLLHTREYISMGAAGAQTRRSLEHHLLHPRILTL